MRFFKLKILAIEKPIKNTASISFHIPQHLHETFNHRPGQHLVIKFHIEGKEVHRSYSLHSCPYKSEPPQITIKRIKNGLVSNYVNDKLKVGDELEVMTPQGKFYAKINTNDYKTYFLFAAGSGITPIFSILKSVLVIAPYSMVNLFYGNTNQDTIIFKKELNALQRQFPDRLTIVHTLSTPKVWTTWEKWTGRKGRITSKDVEWFINEHPPIAQNTEYYICDQEP